MKTILNNIQADHHVHEEITQLHNKHIKNKQFTRGRKTTNRLLDFINDKTKNTLGTYVKAKNIDNYKKKLFWNGKNENHNQTFIHVVKITQQLRGETQQC